MKKKFLALVALLVAWGGAVMAQQTVSLSLQVTAVTGEDMGGTPFYLERTESGLVYERVLSANGTYTERNIYPGIHRLVIEKDGLKTYDNAALDIQSDTVLKIVMEEPVRTPYNLQASLAHDPKTGTNDASLVWNEETDYFFDNFEDYTSFTLDLSPWTGIDKDQESAAVLMQGGYPNSGLKQYATIVSPDEAYVNVSDGGDPYPLSWWFYAPQLRAYSGKKYMGFIRTASGTTNNDWAITPQIHVGVNNVVRFKAKAADAPTERFKVWISTTGTDESNFMPLTQGNYESVEWSTWSTIEYDLSKYEGQDVYIAIQYITQAGWMLMVDDFFVGPSKLNPSLVKARLPRAIRHRSVSANDDPQSYTVYLDDREVGSVQTNSFFFENLAAGTHTLGVKAIYKVSESSLATTQIEVPEASAYADVKVQVSVNGGSSEGIAVSYLSGSYQVTDTLVSGLSHFASLPKGEYVIGINDDRYQPLDTLINIDRDMTVDLALVERITNPYNLSVDFTYHDDTETTDATFRWNQDLGWSDSFEEYDDFATHFGDWVTYDLDRLQHYMLSVNGQNVTFPGFDDGESPVFIFNPEATTPPCNVDGYLNTLWGKKYVMFFGVQRATSNDWLIAPKQKINEGYVVRFYVHVYGNPGETTGIPETIRVLASETSTDDSSFTELYKCTFEEGGWYEVTVDLPDYVNREIYLAINYVSNDGWMLKVDNFYVGPADDAPAPEVGNATYNVYLNGETKATAITDNFYTFESLPDGTYTAGVKAVYESGESDLVEYLFTTQYSALESVAVPAVKVCARDRAIWIESVSGEQVSATVYNAAGQPVASVAHVEGNTRIPVEAGFYLVRVTTQDGPGTIKVLVR
ncbi:MAG TPA: T9SS type A sorting domain-containing protein [Candidatus Barnesiella merdipullorum]|nr:T9SS type A sorting domain-containing protein [Candidatus Barnesiella merdipullorum]